MSLPALKQKTTPLRPYRDFDAYVEAAKRFNDLSDKLQDEIGYRAGRLTPEELEHYKRLVVKWDQAFYEFFAGYKCYES
jgi:hypothetical protein